MMQLFYYIYIWFLPSVHQFCVLHFSPFFFSSLRSKYKCFSGIEFSFSHKDNLGKEKKFQIPILSISSATSKYLFKHFSKQRPGFFWKGFLVAYIMSLIFFLQPFSFYNFMMLFIRRGSKIVLNFQVFTAD